MNDPELKHPGKQPSALAGTAAATNYGDIAAVPFEPLETLFQSGQGLTQMQAALNRMIDEFQANSAATPELDASAYLEALKMAPHLIATESDPNLFLRREDGDAEAAARRLLKYWACRRDIFGPNLSFRSLLNGDAIDSEALLHLRSGSHAVLPVDSSGRSVLCFDLDRRIHGEGALLARMRAQFYVISLLFSNPKSQSEGAVFVVTFSQGNSLAQPNGKKLFRVLAEALPLKCHSHYMACCVPRGAKRLFLDELIPGADHSSGALLFPSVIPPAVGIVGYSPAELCEQLEQRGLKKHNLPASLGGTWDYPQFSSFVDSQFSSRTVQEQHAHDDGENDKKPPASETAAFEPGNDFNDQVEPGAKKPAADQLWNLDASLIAAPHVDELRTSTSDTVNSQIQPAAIGTVLLSKTDLLKHSPAPPSKQLERHIKCPSVTYAASISYFDEIARLFQSSQALSTMYIALVQMISESKQNPVTTRPDASAFIEAVERSPHLIAKESHPAMFLRREDGDSVAACRRLLKYWTCRRDILGPDLAYCCLLTGDALDSETIRRMKFGVFVNLPPDRDGRSVVCLDLERRCRGVPGSEAPYRPKGLFYVLSQTFANPKSQSDGVVLLRILTQNGSLDVPNTKMMFGLIAEALPMKVHSRHIACCAPPGAKQLFLDQLIPALRRMNGTESLPDPITHVGDSPPDLCRQLVYHGFQKDCLPPSTGGTWDYQQFVDFLDEQMRGRAECSQALGAFVDVSSCYSDDVLVPLQHNENSKRPTLGSSSASAYKEDASVGPNTLSFGGDKHLGDRRSKKKKRPALEPGQGSAKLVSVESRLSVDHDQVRFSEDSLLKLDAAMGAIPAECFDQGTTEEERTAYNRKRNAIYSKRKYYKTKLQLEILECSQASLLAKNKALKEENIRLEDLYEKAQRAVLAHEEGRQQDSSSSVVASGRTDVLGEIDRGLELVADAALRNEATHLHQIVGSTSLSRTRLVKGASTERIGQLLSIAGLCENGTSDMQSGRKPVFTTALKPPPGVSTSDYSYGMLPKLGATTASIPVDGFRRFESNEDKADYARKQNAVYCRRKYYRKKLQVQSLERSKDGLLAENKVLKDENQRLEDLCQMAEREILAHEAREFYNLTPMAGSGFSCAFTGGGGTDPCAPAPWPPNQGQLPLAVDSLGLRRSQLVAALASEEARRLSVQLGSASLLHSPLTAALMDGQASRRVSPQYSILGSPHPDNSLYQSVRQTGLQEATHLPSSRGYLLSNNRIPDMLGLMPTGIGYNVNRRDHLFDFLSAAQQIAPRHIGGSSATEQLQLGLLNAFGRAQPPRASLEQACQLLHESRVRQDLAAQIALELSSALPAQAAPSLMGQQPASAPEALLSRLELEQILQWDRTRNSVLSPLLDSQSVSQLAALQRLSDDDLRSMLMARQRFRE